MAKKRPLTLEQKREVYEAQLDKTQLALGCKMLEVERLRNRQNYLKRCIKAIDSELGDRDDGQLVFAID